jgi:hypothetical protein
MRDPITDFVEQSHEEPESRAELKMRKDLGGADFCIRARGGKDAIKKLADTLNAIDLEEAQR